MPSLTFEFSDILKEAPQFSTLDDPARAAIVEDVENEIGDVKTSFGKRYGRAAGNLGAHFLASRANAELGIAGVVVAETVGPLQRQYRGPSTSDDSLDTTPYGREFKRLRGLNLGRFGMVL